MADSAADSAPQPSPDHRRGFLGRLSTVAMVGGLAASYGTFAAMAGRYLYPAGSRPTAWIFVTDASRLKNGETMPFVLPTGQTVTLTRRGEGAAEEDFLALSTTCPHLGCRVHWEPQHDRFFCPCHNGAFDATGKATAGPPAEAGQTLPHYPIRVDKGLVFIQIPVDRLG